MNDTKTERSKTERSKTAKREATPPKRLLTIVASTKTSEVSDPELRSWTDRAQRALFHLFAAAKLDGEFELVHDAAGRSRFIYVNAKTRLQTAVDLFVSGKSVPISAADAGEKVVLQAREELLRFVRAEQAVALSAVVAAAERVSATQQQLHSYLSSTIRTAEDGRLRVKTHANDYILALQDRANSSVAMTEIEVEAKLWRLARDHLIVRPLKSSRQKHDWLSRTMRVNLAAKLQVPSSLRKIFVKAVVGDHPIKFKARAGQRKAGSGARFLLVESPVEFGPKPSRRSAGG